MAQRRTNYHTESKRLARNQNQQNVQKEEHDFLKKGTTRWVRIWTITNRKKRYPTHNEQQYRSGAAAARLQTPSKREAMDGWSFPVESNGGNPSDIHSDDSHLTKSNARIILSCNKFQIIAHAYPPKPFLQTLRLPFCWIKDSNAESISPFVPEVELGTRRQKKKYR